jgi:exodeoxyribonuclease VII small subunit
MDEELSFEKAFERLEKILETINGGKISLEESLKLFEEAETLMRLCSHRLNHAEQKIEQLIRGRNGELKTESF